MFTETRIRLEAIFEDDNSIFFSRSLAVINKRKEKHLLLPLQTVRHLTIRQRPVLVKFTMASAWTSSDTQIIIFKGNQNPHIKFTLL